MALGWVWWRLVARGAAALCVAGVALGDIHPHFAWQAWHLATSTCTLRGRRSNGLGLVTRLGPFSRPGRRGTLRGRRGTWRHPSALCVAGVELGDIHLRFASVHVLATVERPALLSTEVKLRFNLVHRNPFARNGRWTSKTEVKLRFNLVKCNPFARNGRWTPKTEVKLRF